MALLDYINSLQPDDRTLFAERCGVSLNYLRQVAYGNRRCRESLAINIERESRRSVVCEALRPDVDWAYLRAGSYRPMREMAAAEVSHG